MAEIDTQQLRVLAGLLVSVAGLLAIGLKVLFKFIDQRWPMNPPVQENGNGSTKRVCFMGAGGAAELREIVESEHENLRSAMHQNHAAVLAILDRLSRTIEESQRTTSAVERSLAVLTDRWGRHG